MRLESLLQIPVWRYGIVLVQPLMSLLAVSKQIDERGGLDSSKLRATISLVTARLLPRRFCFDASDEQLVVNKAVEEVVPILG